MPHKSTPVARAYARAYYWRHRARILDLVAERRDGAKENVKKLREKRRVLAIVDAIKIASPCADCGEHFPAVCMDFDHLPGMTKVDSVSKLVGRCSMDRLYAEIAKCELVCANCHRIRTHSRTKRKEI